MLGSIGPLANANAYRFSSKEYHVNSGLYDFGPRWYEPNLQRWIARDPAGIEGGVNLYEFVYENPINRIDPDGLLTIGLRPRARAAMDFNSKRAINLRGATDTFFLRTATSGVALTQCLIGDVVSTAEQRV